MRRITILAALVVLAFGVAGAALGAQAETGTLVINVVDADGNRLTGACYVFPFSRSTAFAVCDNDEKDADPAEGRIEVHDVIAGFYEMGQATAPNGYQLRVGANDFSLEVSAGEITEIDVIYQH